MITTHVTTKKPKPFLKWVGGKSKLTAQLKALMPEQYGTFYEPFVGGGALFFHVRPDVAIINDINKPLIGLYKNIQERPGELVGCLKGMQKTYYLVGEEEKQSLYYKARSEYNDIADPYSLRKSCLLVFLNKTCYNGLYRENSKGGFNVPFGRYEKPQICDAKTILTDSELLQDVQITSVSFELAIAKAQEGDFVYFDPPYYPLTKTSNFTSYSEWGFEEKDQVKLREVFKQLDNKGCYLMLSNSSTPFIKDLYADYRIEAVSANRAINSKAKGRGKIEELVILNY